MGNFYTNVVLRGPADGAVYDFLRYEGWTAWVSPRAPDGSTVVFERACEEQDLDVLDELASRLAHEFGVPALGALVHDDDVLLLRLHVPDGIRTRLAFAYDSTELWHRDVAVVARAFGAEQAIVPLWWTLHRPHLTVILEFLRHRRVLELLGLPWWAAATGYTYIEKGDVPEDLAKGGLRHTRR